MRNKQPDFTGLTLTSPAGRDYNPPTHDTDAGHAAGPHMRNWRGNSLVLLEKCCEKNVPAIPARSQAPPWVPLAHRNCWWS